MTQAKRETAESLARTIERKMKAWKAPWNESKTLWQSAVTRLGEDEVHLYISCSAERHSEGREGHGLSGSDINHITNGVMESMGFGSIFKE